MKPNFETVGQIKKGNTHYTYENHSAFDVANELLHSRETGMPVLNRENQVIGIISEQDLIRALRDSRRLDEIKVGEIMTRSVIVIDENTTLQKAGEIMEDAHIHRLPVVREGEFIGTINRHDLLRASLGMDVEI